MNHRPVSPVGAGGGQEGWQEAQERSPAWPLLPGTPPSSAGGRREGSPAWGGQPATQEMLEKSLKFSASHQNWAEAIFHIWFGLYQDV